MKIYLRRHHAKIIGDGIFSHKMDWFWKFLEILNLKGHPNCIIGSKVKAILLDWWVLPIVGVVSEGSAPAAYAAGLFYIFFIYIIPLLNGTLVPIFSCFLFNLKLSKV